jgi:redox-sensitive bicupin YhaK (pirin superfamily)
MTDQKDVVTTISNDDEINNSEAPTKVTSRSMVGGVIASVEMRPEEVTKTKMRKFCFRQPNQQIATFYLKNKTGQEFELEIDEATVRAMVQVFKGKKSKIKKEKTPDGAESAVSDAESAESTSN